MAGYRLPAFTVALHHDCDLLGSASAGLAKFTQYYATSRLVFRRATRLVPAKAKVESSVMAEHPRLLVSVSRRVCT